MSTPIDFSKLNNKSWFKKAVDSEGIIKFDKSVIAAALGPQFGGAFFPEPNTLRAAHTFFNKKNVTEASFNRYKRWAQNNIKGVESEALQNVDYSDFTHMLRLNSKVASQESIQLVAKFKKEIRPIIHWSKFSGVGPIILSDVGSPEIGRVVANHEDIHVAHYLNQDHPQVNKLINKSPSLKKAIKKSLTEEKYKIVLGSGLTGSKEEVATYLASQYEYMHQQMKANGLEHLASWANKSERLAHAYENDTNILNVLEQKGVKTRRVIATELKQKAGMADNIVKSTMELGNSNKSIGWVSKLASGAKRMRSLL